MFCIQDNIDSKAFLNIDVVYSVNNISHVEVVTEFKKKILSQHPLQGALHHHSNHILNALCSIRPHTKSKLRQCELFISISKSRQQQRKAVLAIPRHKLQTSTMIASI